MSENVGHVTIALSWAEVLLAAQVGIMRQVQNLKLGREQANNHDPGRDWQDHIDGALGECAAAKWMGRYWHGRLGSLGLADVGSYEVRTAAKPGHALILHESDQDDRAFILVTGLNGRYAIRGWILGRDGKRPEFWKDPAGGRGAFFVPQSALADPLTLPNHTKGGKHGDDPFL